MVVRGFPVLDRELELIEKRGAVPRFDHPAKAAVSAVRQWELGSITPALYREGRDPPRAPAMRGFPGEI